MCLKFTRLAGLNLILVSLLTSCGEAAQDSATAGTAIYATKQKYEGKIVRQSAGNRGKDDGWYLVKNGKRNWITNSTWLERNGYKAGAVIEISKEEFNSIPEDPQSLQ